MTRSPGHESKSAKTPVEAKGRSIGRTRIVSPSGILFRSADRASSSTTLRPAALSRIQPTLYRPAMAAARRSSVTTLTRLGSTSSIASFNVWFRSRSQNNCRAAGSKQSDRRDLPRFKFLQGIRMCIQLRFPAPKISMKVGQSRPQFDRGDLAARKCGNPDTRSHRRCLRVRSTARPGAVQIQTPILAPPTSPASARTEGDAVIVVRPDQTLG
jgi:hypothetical protein